MQNSLLSRILSVRWRSTPALTAWQKLQRWWNSELCAKKKIIFSCISDNDFFKWHPVFRSSIQFYIYFEVVFESILSSSNILELSSQNKFLTFTFNFTFVLLWGNISKMSTTVVISFSTAVSATKVVLCDFCSTVFSSFFGNFHQCCIFSTGKQRRLCWDF